MRRWMVIISLIRILYILIKVWQEELFRTQRLYKRLCNPPWEGATHFIQWRDLVYQQISSFPAKDILIMELPSVRIHIVRRSHFKIRQEKRRKVYVWKRYEKEGGWLQSPDRPFPRICEVAIGCWPPSPRYRTFPGGFKITVKAKPQHRCSRTPRGKSSCHTQLLH